MYTPAHEFWLISQSRKTPASGAELEMVGKLLSVGLKTFSTAKTVPHSYRRTKPVPTTVCLLTFVTSQRHNNHAPSPTAAALQTNESFHTATPGFISAPVSEARHFCSPVVKGMCLLTCWVRFVFSGELVFCFLAFFWRDFQSCVFCIFFWHNKAWGAVGRLFFWGGGPDVVPRQWLQVPWKRGSHGHLGWYLRSQVPWECSHEQLK